MKAKISDYFCKNCKDAANDGILWYAVSLNRNQIMYTIDNVCLFIVDYDPRLLAIFEYVKGATRNYEIVRNDIFYYDDKFLVLSETPLTDMRPRYIYKYHDNEYLHIGDYFFNYSYFKRKIPSIKECTIEVYTPREGSMIAVMVVYENNRACAAIVNCGFKKVGIYD